MVDYGGLMATGVPELYDCKCTILVYPSPRGYGGK